MSGSAATPMPATETTGMPRQPPSYDATGAAPINDDYYAPRVRDFEPASCGASIHEPDADSQLPSYAAAARRPWGKYKSEAAYLDALRKFVLDKDYIDGPVDTQGKPVGLIGFYGSKTGADYAAGPGLRDGRTKSKSSKPTADGTGSNAQGGRDAVQSGIEDQHLRKNGIKSFLRRNRTPKPH